MSKKQKRQVIGTLISLATILIVLFANRYNNENNIANNNSNDNNQIVNEQVSDKTIENNKNSIVEGTLNIHMIDVGQGDSILFMQKDKVMLIDAGTKESSDTVLKYLKSLNISKIDYLIGTHPHEDHMGGMAEVVKNFDIGTIYVPNTSKEKITSKYYLNFLEAVQNKNLKLTYPKVGDEILLGDAKVLFLAPSKDKYEDINNYSIATKTTFGDVSIVSTGDCEKEAEDEILKTGLDVKAQIYKAGHHGSSSSSSKKFINAVNPEYALISVGKDNSYGHPHKETINLFEKLNIKIKRTDELGTVIITTDGKNINFNK